MKKVESKIKISDLQRLNDAVEKIDSLERQIEALDDHLKSIAEDEGFSIRGDGGLNIPVYMRQKASMDNGSKFAANILIPPSLIPYEKLIAKHIKKLRKNLSELQCLFNKEDAG